MTVAGMGLHMAQISNNLYANRRHSQQLKLCLGKDGALVKMGSTSCNH